MSDIPCDPAAERSLLGSTWSGLGLKDPEARAVLWEVPPEAFFISEHRRLWGAMRSLVEAGKEPTELVLAWEAFAGHPSPDEKASVFEVLAVGADLTPGPLRSRVLDLYARRVAIAAARRIIVAAEDFGMPSEEVTATANTAFLEISRGPASGSRFWSSSDLLPTVQAAEGFRSGAAAKKLLYFGVSSLDSLLLGTPGDVTVLGGRPGGGKSGLALQARNLTAMAGIIAGYFSLEMDEPQINARDAAWWFSDPRNNVVFSYKAMLQGGYDASAALGVLRASGQIEGMARALSWHHSAGIPMGKLAAYITEAVHAHGLELAVIDYFQYIKPERQKGDSLASAYAANSQAIKRLAQELKIHILLLSQLNRENDGKIPNLTDLKETSQLEQDASAVPMLYRDKDGKLAVTLPKHRDGETFLTHPIEASWPCLHFSSPLRETQQAFF